MVCAAGLLGLSAVLATVWFAFAGAAAAAVAVYLLGSKGAAAPLRSSWRWPGSRSPTCSTR
ncbi:hypothetical protein ACFQ0B_79775 [Nonomuraea thailandensis]